LEQFNSSTITEYMKHQHKEEETIIEWMNHLSELPLTLFRANDMRSWEEVLAKGLRVNAANAVILFVTVGPSCSVGQPPARSPNSINQINAIPPETKYR
jgi:hypothetical protein